MIKGKIIKNTFANAGGKLLYFVLQLVIITYLIKTLGKEAYGGVVLALALATNVQLLEAGFGVAVTKYVAECRIRGEQERLLEIVNTNIIVTTVLAVIFAAALLVVNEFFLQKIFTLPPLLLINTKNLIRILIPFSIIEFWSISIVRVAEGFQRYPVVRLIGLMKWMLRLLFVYIAVENGYGLASVGIAYLGAAVVTLVVLYVTIFVKDSVLKINLSLCSKKSFKLLFNFSIWVFLAKIFTFLSYRIDVILIGIFLAPVYLTYYDVAFKIYEALNFAIGVIPSALLPITSELGSLKDMVRLRSLFRKVSKYTLMFTWPLFIFTLFYSQAIVNLWMGQGFNTAVLLTQLFMISLCFFVLTSSGAEMLVGLNRVKDLAFWSGIASVINLTISLALIQRIGVYGVVVGTLIGTCILSFGRLYLILPIFNFPFVSFIRDIVKNPAVALVVLGSFLFILSENLLVGIIGLVSYFISVTIFMLDKDDKREVTKLFKLERKAMS